MPFRLFNLHEVAEYLHVSEDAIEELARRGEIPCERQGGRVVFRHKDVDAWASQRLLGLPDARLTAYHRRLSETPTGEVDPSRPILPSMLDASGIRLGLVSRGKAGIIGEMTELADSTGLVCDVAELHESLVEREKLCSTALPGGFALLHPRNHEPYMFAESFIVLGRSAGQLVFGAPDGESTDIFFLICCQDDRIHLHVLARLCMMCHHTGVLQKIRDAATPAEVVDALLDAERAVLKP